MKRKQVNKKKRLPQEESGVFFVGNTQHSATKKFGFALRRRRILLGMTQSELSRKSGIDRSYISGVECGKEGISLDRADILSRCVQSTLSELLNSVEI